MTGIAGHELIVFGQFLLFKPCKKCFDPDPDVFEIKNYSQNSRYNNLYKIATAAGINIQKWNAHVTDS